ncbi:hypothetical protein MLD38_018788 [Melastoma candidum]|uniref:Uncharacterized protein n=1 Tax=Melastoma candidum TaxID=119954 RepID=A0ACB9QUX9_9MYRT|nr:hypothetical protein MLD38_018788 [Melastoma candidum]
MMRALPTPVKNLEFSSITNGIVEDIASLNSKLFHIELIKDIDIKIGDDCISFGDGSQQVYVSGVTCGPGHGISVGSLGKFQGPFPDEVKRHHLHRDPGSFIHASDRQTRLQRGSPLRNVVPPIVHRGGSNALLEVGKQLPTKKNDDTSSRPLRGVVTPILVEAVRLARGMAGSAKIEDWVRASANLKEALLLYWVFGPASGHKTTTLETNPVNAGERSVLEDAACFRPTSLKDLEKPLQS